MESDTRALTGIRGVAALWVAGHHFSIGYESMPLKPLFARGYLAVDLFFVLSGFVIAMNNGAAFVRRDPSAAYGAFYRRRIARVYPLLLVASLLILSRRLAVGQELPSPLAILSSLSLTNAWLGQKAIIGPAWSVSAEAFAYLLFPLIAARAFACTRAARLAMAVLACWAGLAWITTLDLSSICVERANGPLDVHDGPLALLRCVAGFVAGVCTFRLSEHPRVRAVLATTGTAEAALGVALSAAWFGADLVFAVSSAILVASLSVPRHAASRVLRSPPAMWLGEISYAIYLVHVAVGLSLRDVLFGHVGTGWVVACCMLAAVAAAALLHVVVERPAHRWLRRTRAVASPYPATGTLQVAV